MTNIYLEKIAKLVEKEERGGLAAQTAVAGLMGGLYGSASYAGGASKGKSLATAALLTATPLLGHIAGKKLVDMLDKNKTKKPGQ